MHAMNWESSPGGGTRIRVELPVAAV